jgi:hypothetical protein
MGRSISLFRKYLLKIEKLELSSLKRLLPTKRNRMEFDKVFDNVRVYTSYLGNALNPVPLESVSFSASSITINNFCK